MKQYLETIIVVIALIISVGIFIWDISYNSRYAVIKALEEQTIACERKVK